MSQFKLYQGQHLKQEMRINPRLYQAMELLYMPLLDLQQHLKTEMAENPFLEMSEADVVQELELKEEAPEEKPDENEIDWEEILLDGFDAGGRKQEYEHKEYIPPTAVETPDLRDELTRQLRMLDMPERELRLGEEIIGNLNDGGLLSCGLDEVVEALNEWLSEVRAIALDRAREIEDEEERAEELAELETLFADYTVEEAEEILIEIQRLDPPGVGARSLQESILIQMRQAGEVDTLAFRVVEGHFQDLVNHKWSDIARALDASPREVQEAADTLSRFDPKPGLGISSDPEHYVIPDLVVEKIDGEYMVFVNDTNLPRLRISRAYREVARDRNKFTGENKEFISAKLNSANWMIQAIEQRRQTMLKVMNFIVDRQREFFEKGVQYLRPLTLREVAEHIDMHESTVSRVTNEKFVQTPRGVYSLKFFFSSGLSTDSGEDISARGVKDKIRNLVDDEDEKKPLTDAAIVRLLKDDGVQIARRTVAKYRDQLGILPARMRKRV
ncbi:RNA polymerase factor sigma-54 [Gaopeijia maritima]|uniref:RNA polymerase factor sigma-54 n=1 Tax=Gaopeijia maritima TaxID=3119007 RepID=A0ABU9E7V0_9BACT